MLDPLVSRTLAPVYHSWHPNQHTTNITHPFPIRVIHVRVGVTADSVAWGRVPAVSRVLRHSWNLCVSEPVPVVSKVLRNPRNSCVFEPSYRTFPLRMLRLKVPILCRVILCPNCLGWHLAHLYHISSRYGLDCPLTFMFPTSGSAKSLASSCGFVTSCKWGVRATHSPEIV